MITTSVTNLSNVLIGLNLTGKQYVDAILPAILLYHRQRLNSWQMHAKPVLFG